MATLLGNIFKVEKCESHRKFVWNNQNVWHSNYPNLPLFLDTNVGSKRVARSLGESSRLYWHGDRRFEFKSIGKSL